MYVIRYFFFCNYFAKIVLVSRGSCYLGHLSDYRKTSILILDSQLRSRRFCLRELTEPRVSISSILANTCDFTGYLRADLHGTSFSHTTNLRHDLIRPFTRGRVCRKDVAG